jgi:hypothetical protein
VFPAPAYAPWRPKRAAEVLDDHILVREHHHERAFLGEGTSCELEDLDQGQQLVEGVGLIRDLTTQKDVGHRVRGVGMAQTIKY